MVNFKLSARFAALHNPSLTNRKETVSLDTQVKYSHEVTPALSSVKKMHEESREGTENYLLAVV